MVMGGQQVCIQTFRPCNDGGVIVTTQEEIFFFCEKSIWREIESGRDTREGYRRRSCQEKGEEEREKKRERKRGKEGSKDRSFCTHVRTLS